MSLVCFCWQCSRFSFWGLSPPPYVEHDVKSITLAGWQFVEVTLQQHVFHVLLNWPFMYHRKLSPLFLPGTVLLRLTDKFVFSRWLSFTFSLSNLPVRFPFCPKFGNFRSGYSIVYLNCCGLCRPCICYTAATDQLPYPIRLYVPLQYLVHSVSRMFMVTINLHWRQAF